MCIDDMIGFCESERDYHSKEADKRKEICFANETPEIHSYMLGNHLGFEVAYNNMAESLIKLKKNQNEKVKEIIDWCQEETDICLRQIRDKSLSDQVWGVAIGRKVVLDTIKDKLCSIYEVNEHEA